MKRFLLIALVILSSTFASAQIVSTSPAFPVANQPVTITVDVTGTSLDKFAWDNTNNPVYIWTWIKKAGASDTDAPTNVNPATAAQSAAKCTRISTNPDKYQITFTPTVFFNKAATDIPSIGLKLKTKDWAENKQTDVDKFIDLTPGFNASFGQPTKSSFLKNTSDQFDIVVNASENSSLTLKINGNTVSSLAGVTTLTYHHTVTETSGTTQVVCEAIAGAQSKTISFSYTIRSATVSEARPAGITDGINYSADATTATLSLWAPGKTSVYVIGDFTNWDLNGSYQLKKDGEHFWIEIGSLTSGQEYAFQYLVDESIYMADPYADKILDPDDQYIPLATYPNLKSFPAKALSDKWYFNRTAVLQTGQQPYVWQVSNFTKPAKEKLTIYELLIRDFFDSGNRNYQNLMDTLGYFKRLGINAIELMPVMEFNGNESWGYNPTFMFAPDKYYGTKNKFKEFIDKCHQNGIAVILDIAMNHHDLPNPYVMMDFDFVNMKPQADNKWFNVSATHPFNVFFDMNHESAYTKKYLDTVNYHWLNEYKVDGFRFDLSKGFTQVNNPNDVNAWSAYDATRIAILKRMADKIWSHTPDAYVILEHLSANAEEKELAEYRADEGKGMMPWGNMTYQYGQNTMGFAGSSDITGIDYASTSRNWTAPRLVGYMESHDEERLMYKNLQYGNTSGDYNVKSLNTSLARMKAVNCLFYALPGPKMLWEFGELGYDYSINYCQDGSNNSDCRISPKPVKWDYMENSLRKQLFDHIADLIRLRNTYPIFTEGQATITSGNSLVKQITLKGVPYKEQPSNEDEMNVQIAVNLDVEKKDVAISFPHTGTWYDYYAGAKAIVVNALPFTLAMKPGEYKLYTDYSIELGLVTGSEQSLAAGVTLFPNPVAKELFVSGEKQINQLVLYTNQGAVIHPTRTTDNSWDVNGLPLGLYIVEVRSGNSIYRSKIVKK
jgi:1,4-alpha-glucan branching enzyme